jgi:hypothetical protein
MRLRVWVESSQHLAIPRLGALGPLLSITITACDGSPRSMVSVAGSPLSGSAPSVLLAPAAAVAREKVAYPARDPATWDTRRTGG